MENTQKSKKVTRSPNYPAISLGEAISKIRMMYQEMHTHSADRETIARAIGYKSLNGASATVISALQKFNLLEPEGSEYKVSEKALNVILHSKGSLERVAAISDVAFTPAAFQDLREKYGNVLPNDDHIRAYLVKTGYNPKAISTVIRVFRDTISFAEEEGALTDKMNSHESSASAEAMSKNSAPQVSRNQIPHAAQGQSTFQSPSTHQVPVPQHFGNIPSASAELWGDKELKFQVTAECEARIQLKGSITQEAIERLSAFIELSKSSFPTEAQLKSQQPQKAVQHEKEYVSGVSEDKVEFVD